MRPAISTPDYAAFLAALKERILHARTSAARAVNRDLVLLYWDIGQGIVEKQQAAGWGDAVVERLAADLRAEFPDMRGFSVANLWRMKQLYLEHTSPDFLAQAVREMKAGGTGSDQLAQAVRELASAIPWGHHVFLLGRLNDPGARFYYLRATTQFGWSRSVLLNQIKAGAYERAVKDRKTHNFTLALPEHFAEQAGEMMKSRYNLEFLGIGRAMKERELEDRLIWPSIGIILCAEKDDVEVEFALKTKTNPIGVAEYQLKARLPAEFKGRLPTARQLASAVREALPTRK